MDTRLVRALTPLIDAFDELGIVYELGGSVASSVHGVPRSSLDIDILSALKSEHVSDLVQKLEGDYYLSQTRATDAVERETSFNMIHLDTMFKVDVFVARSNEFRRSSLTRRRLESLTEERDFFVTSAEDIVLHKLLWYRKGGEVSDRQRQDVIGVLKVQGPNLDREYLQDWSAKLQVADLLQQALSQAAEHEADGP